MGPVIWQGSANRWGFVLTMYVDGCLTVVSSELSWWWLRSESQNAVEKALRCVARLSHPRLTPRRGSAGHTGPRCSPAACSPTHHDSLFRLPAPGLRGSRSACWPRPGRGQRLCARLSFSLGLCMLSRTGRPHRQLWFPSPLPAGRGGGLAALAAPVASLAWGFGRVSRALSSCSVGEGVVERLPYRTGSLLSDGHRSSFSAWFSSRQWFRRR